MFGRTKGSRFATVSLRTDNQDIDAIHELVRRLAGLAGCEKCGRMALLHIDFASDPPPDLRSDLIVSFEHQNLAR